MGCSNMSARKKALEDVTTPTEPDIASELPMPISGLSVKKSDRSGNLAVDRSDLSRDQEGKGATPDHGILNGKYYQTLKTTLAKRRPSYTAVQIGRASLRQDTNAFLETGNPLFALRALADALQDDGPVPPELVTYFRNSVFFIWDTINHMINASEGAPSPSKAAELFGDCFGINGGKGRDNAFAAMLKEHQVKSQKRQKASGIVLKRDDIFKQAKEVHGKRKIKLAVADAIDKTGVSRTTIYDAGVKKRRGRTAHPSQKARLGGK